MPGSPADPGAGGVGNSNWGTLHAATVSPRSVAPTLIGASNRNRRDRSFKGTLEGIIGVSERPPQSRRDDGQSKHFTDSREGAWRPLEQLKRRTASALKVVEGASMGTRCNLRTDVAGCKRRGERAR